MNRIWLGAGVAAVLLIALVVALVAGGSDATTTTVALPTTTTSPPTTTTSSTAVPTTTTTTAAPTTTTTSTIPADEREAEVLALVGELELRMFQAVYNSDLAELAEVVGSKQLYERLLPAANSPSQHFVSAPTPASYEVELLELLLDRADCVVVAVREDPTAFLNDEGAIEELVVVVWPLPDSAWRLAERFGGGVPESSWLPQCDLQNRDWRP